MNNVPDPLDELLKAFPLKLNGKNALSLGLTLTLYYRNTNENNLDPQLAQCMQDYLDMAPDRPKLAGIPTSDVVQDLTKKTIQSPAQLLEKKKPTASWDAYYIWAANDEEVADWYMEVIRCPPLESWALSYFHCSFPLTVFRNPDLAHRVVKWSGLLKAFHGYAGIGLLVAPDIRAASRMDRVVYETAQQYPGINVDNPTLQSAYLLNGIKTVDWLTILGPSLLAKLDGIQALRSKLDAQFELTPLIDGGVLIKAGAKPSLGGTGASLGPAAYIELNRILRPVRESNMKGNFQWGMYGPPFFDQAASEAWMKRFDE